MLPGPKQSHENVFLILHPEDSLYCVLKINGEKLIKAKENGKYIII